MWMVEDVGLEWRICPTEAGVGKRKPPQFLKAAGGSVSGY